MHITQPHYCSVFSSVRLHLYCAVLPPSCPAFFSTSLSLFPLPFPHFHYPHTHLLLHLLFSLCNILSPCKPFLYFISSSCRTAEHLRSKFSHNQSYSAILDPTPNSFRLFFLHSHFLFPSLSEYFMNWWHSAEVRRLPLMLELTQHKYLLSRLSWVCRERQCVFVCLTVITCGTDPWG